MAALTAGETQLWQARLWRKFQLLTRGRIDALRALEIILQEESTDVGRNVVGPLRDAVSRGQQLSEALDAQPAVFSISARELIRSAERTGAWDDILPLLAQGLADGTFD